MSERDAWMMLAGSALCACGAVHIGASKAKRPPRQAWILLYEEHGPRSEYVYKRYAGAVTTWAVGGPYVLPERVRHAIVAEGAK